MAQVVLFCTCDKEINHSKFPTVTTSLQATEDGKILPGGEVSDDGGSEITDKGICLWDDNIEGRLDLDNCQRIFSAGPGKGSFTIEEADFGGRFSIRAYAVNKKGVAYGEIISSSNTIRFAYLYVHYISQNSAQLDSKVYGSTGERGFCWSTSPNPTLNNNHVKEGSGEGTFSTNLTDLQPNTRYYVRAYAKDEYGICHLSEEINFVTYQACPSSVQDYDGNTYGVVSIGSQCWMKENLRTTHLNNGTAITLVQDSTAWANRTTGAYCYYNKTNYGNLYNYYAVAYGNLCPSGWHVPSYDEVFTTLYYALDASNVGGKMKVTGTTYWMSPNTGATNSTGFSARGGGYRPRGYGFSDIRKSAVFWTTTTYSSNSDYAYDFMMSYDAGELYRYGSSSYDYSIDKKSGLSVRCVKNSSKGSNESNVVDPVLSAPSKEARP